MVVIKPRQTRHKRTDRTRGGGAGGGGVLPWLAGESRQRGLGREEEGEGRLTVNSLSEVYNVYCFVAWNTPPCSGPLMGVRWAGAEGGRAYRSVVF